MPEQSGERLDVLIAGADPLISRTKAKNLIVSGAVSINKNPAEDPSLKVKAGEEVCYRSIAVVPPSVTIPVNLPVEVHFEDAHLLVVYKPAGMVTHPSAGHESDSLSQRVMYGRQLPENPEYPSVRALYTGGYGYIRAFDAAKAHLTEQFSTHSVCRRYMALIWGKPRQQRGTIDKKLGIHPINRLKRAVSADGKHAVTHWETIQAFDRCTLIKCQLETGRTHQIRVHLASEGYQLVGDTLYTAKRQPGKNIPDTLIGLISQYRGQFLHAYRLGFVHPVLGKSLMFYRRPPLLFEQVLRDQGYTQYQELP
ncbi:hypothetical protein CHS0354_006863 [Potamilus streckersoni]|uniref:Pseudouridine synthase n=1 Tax=Potamilus streckersoni TaxID=2493646 RepID=A0AAE0WCT4_9BIVA|nr:hypothetical protein CHS0354_006863 [Potamilus streckersoni]